jgi:LacI family transcriptional regulator
MKSVSSQTIHEVARRASVSPATVSRVLNGTVRVSAAKRQAVLEAIRQLEYTPSPIARNLSTGRSRAVGILVPDFGGAYYWPILAGLAEQLEEIGYLGIPGIGQWNTKREFEIIDFFISHKVEALLVLGSRTGAELLKNVRVPVVTLGGNTSQGVHSLNLNHEQAGFNATKYLIDRGHSRIVHISSEQGATDVRERVKGYRRAMREAQLEPCIVNGSLLEDGGFQGARVAFERWADTTAIFAADDLMAFGVLHYAAEHGLRVPTDLSLIGFDDISMAAYMNPPLTTIRQPLEEMGALLGRVVRKLLEGRTPELPSLELRLIERASVCMRGGKTSAIKV